MKNLNPSFIKSEIARLESQLPKAKGSVKVSLIKDIRILRSKLAAKGEAKPAVAPAKTAAVEKALKQITALEYQLTKPSLTKFARAEIMRQILVVKERAGLLSSTSVKVNEAAKSVRPAYRINKSNNYYALTK